MSEDSKCNLCGCGLDDFIETETDSGEVVSAWLTYGRNLRIKYESSIGLQNLEVEMDIPINFCPVCGRKL